jgi:hypothetical protein
MARRREVTARQGRAIAQAVSRWLPTAAARVRARVWSSGICGGQSGAGAGFLRVLRFPLPIFIPPPNSPSSQSPGAGTIGQLLADVPSGSSLDSTPHYENKKKIKKTARQTGGVECVHSFHDSTLNERNATKFSIADLHQAVWGNFVLVHTDILWSIDPLLSGGVLNSGRCQATHATIEQRVYATPF